MATMSPGTVAHFAALLQKLLDEWAGKEPPNRAFNARKGD